MGRRNGAGFRRESSEGTHRGAFSDGGYRTGLIRRMSVSGLVPGCYEVVFVK